MKLEIGKEYYTELGQTVRIICVDRKISMAGLFGSSPAVGLMYDVVCNDESVDFWRLDGTHASLKELNLRDARDVLKSSLNLDDPVEILTNGRGEVRHFAGPTLSGIQVWIAGMTSKTVPDVLYRRTAARGTVEVTEFRKYRRCR